MATGARTGSVAEVFKCFLVLGLTSFGGPIAHLGYFRTEFVQRRQWLDEQSYADLVALCQFLPGPASSQVGFAIGLQRARLPGAFAAWAAFTLPSVAILLLFAYSATALAGPVGQALVHGLKLVAVAVVSQAVWGMAQSLCPDRTRASIAVGVVVLIALLPLAAAQILAIMVGALLGLWRCRDLDAGETGHLSLSLPVPIGKGVAKVALATFFGFLLLVPLLASFGHQGMVLFEAFYRAGAFVFGGGHVVLPLLEATVVESGWASEDSFLAGYGAAQAIPGPLFTFAAYLGAIVQLQPNGMTGATIALVGIFLPGMLILLGTLPYWDSLRRRAGTRAAMAGANAAVVGVLGAALYDPIWTNAIYSPTDFAIALAAFLLLAVWKFPPWLVVVLTGTAGALSVVGA